MNPQNQQTNQQFSTYPINQIPVKPERNWYKILSFLLLGVIIITASVLIGMQINKKQESGPRIKPHNQNINNPSSAIPTTNSSAIWKTYTTPYTGSFPTITFKYPEDWIITNNTVNSGSLGKPGTLDFILSKKGYELKLKQHFSDSNTIYIFNDSPTKPEDGPGNIIDVKNLKYTEIITDFGIVRYFINPANSQEYLFSTKGNEYFVLINRFGELKLIVSFIPNDEIFKEAIEIVKSIKINSLNTQDLTSQTSQTNQYQSAFEKCQYQCMEGWGESYSYCKSILPDLIENYNKYISPVTMFSTAFSEKYFDKNNPQKSGQNLMCIEYFLSVEKNNAKTI